MGRIDDVFVKESSLITFLLRVCDSLMLPLFGYLAYAIYGESSELLFNYRVALVFSFFLALAFFPMFGIYTSWRGRSVWLQIRRLLYAEILIFITLVALSVMMKTTIAYSRIWFGLWILLTIFGTAIYRHMVFVTLGLFRKRGWNTKAIALVGKKELNSLVLNRINGASWTGFRIAQEYDAALFSDQAKEQRIRDSEFLKSLVDNNIMEIWVTSPLKDSEFIKHLILMTESIPYIKLRYLPDFSDFQLLLHNTIEDVAGMVMLTLNDTRLDGINSWVKELEDRVLAALILTLISPILLLIALAIKLESSGPVLYKQRRHGWGGKTINVYKFRSMICDAKLNGEFKQATKNDSRVTRVGAFLRKTSLDELPQFFNVLQGRMSIVGPRPHPIELNHQYVHLVEHYFTRHKVKPGITGWAQVSGWRGETDTLEKMQKRVEHDIYYIRNWSLWLDFKIIWLTILHGFSGKNAY